MSRLVLATRNEHKVREVAAILRLLLPGLGPDDVAGLSGIDVPDVVESGTTFEENALLKARAVSRALGVPALADDSGLSVDVLGGMPGVLSARWAGGHGDDGANLRLLIDQLADVPPDRLQAQFVCCVALVMPDGRDWVVRGTMPGRLVREPRGQGGFGYDPIFVADGEQRTNAELSPEEKNRISHRAAALGLIAPTIERVLAEAASPPPGSIAGASLS